MTCPSESDFVALLQGDLNQAKTEALHAHTDTCAECAALVRVLMSVDEPSEGPPLREDSSGVRAPTIGRYEVRTQLGAGAMGVVYEAWDPLLQRSVALKIMRPDLRLRRDPSDILARMMIEARALAALDHPDLLKIYDIGESDDGIFLVSPLIQGVTARRWCRGRSTTEIVELYVRIARALGHAHEHGIVHRDVKPENILVDEKGSIYVMDFGLARLELVDPASSTSRASTFTTIGTILGTPAYMPPEQLDGHVVDHTADQYALCVCLYEALYGFRPFAGQTLEELLDATRRGEVPRPHDTSVSSRVHDVLCRGLRARHVERFESMYVLAHKLEASQASSARLRLVVASCLLCVIASVAATMFSSMGTRSDTFVPDLGTARASANVSHADASAIMIAAAMHQRSQEIVHSTTARA